MLTVGSSNINKKTGELTLISRISLLAIVDAKDC